MKHFLNTKVVNNFLLPSSREPLARNFLKAAAASILYFSREYFQRMFSKHYGEQECIPVGCVPVAAGVCFRGGVCLVPGGVCLVRGVVCLVRGVSAWSRGGSAWSGGWCVWSGGCLPGPGGGLPGPGGGVFGPGGGLPGPGGISACTEADTPPHLWTDTHL